MPHRVTNRRREDQQPSSGVLTPALIAATITALLIQLVGAFARRASLLRASGRLPAQRRRAYVPVRVDERVYAAVYVGGAAATSAGDPDDVDDMGLLARSMEQSIRPRSAPRVHARDVVVPISGGEAPAPRDFPADLFEPDEHGDEPVRIWATFAAAAAVLAGVPAIVRPLEPWAPWLAGVAVALGAAAWWLARRT